MTALVRRWWRQLTSMRTALVLLLVLAVAAVPGSLLPQRAVDPGAVSAFLAENPDWGPVLDRLWGFDVYASPWFAAVYLLLMTSVIGCLVPRLRDFLRAMRRRPPAAPERMSLLPHHRRIDAACEEMRATSTLRRRGFRVGRFERADGEVELAAEKGYLREAGNLLFHFSMLLILVGVAAGSAFGWYANRILVEGADHGFCNSLQQFDEYGLGPQVDASQLPQFCLQLDDFSAEFRDNGQATAFDAEVSYGEGGEAPDQDYLLRVNHPLSLDGANVYLLGHGYALRLTYTDRYGDSQTQVAPFLPEDQTLTSAGAAIFADANVDADGEQDENGQVAFEGLFMPTAPDEAPFTTSLSARPENPRVMLAAYRGDTGLNDGRPQSVYEIDQDQIASGELTPIAASGKLLAPGEEWELDDGTTLRFDEVVRFATLEIRSDPGEFVVLGGAVALLTGLIPALTVRRRRIWVRIGAEQTQVAGLTRTDYPGFGEEFDSVAAALTGEPNSPPRRRRESASNDARRTELQGTEPQGTESQGGAADGT